MSRSAPPSNLIRRGLRLVSGFARAHPLPFALSVTGTLVYAVASVVTTIVLGRLTDDVVLPAFRSGEEPQNKWLWLALLVAVATAKAAGVVTRRFFAGMTNYRIRNDYQTRFADQYVSLSYETIRRYQRGRLVAHTDTDVEQAADAISPLPFTIGVVALLLVGLISMAVVDIYLTLVIVAVLPLLGVSSHIQARLSERPALEVRKSVSRVAAVASESFDGAIIVKTLGRADAEVERLSAEARSLRDHQTVLARVRAVTASLVSSLPDLAVVALIVVGAWRVGQGALTEGDIVQAVALFAVLAFPFHVIGYFLGDLAPAVVADQRIEEILSLPREEPAAGQPLPGGALAVDLTDVDVRVGGGTLVEGVDLAVQPGEVVALVGATGSGKSTLLHAIAGLLPLAGGQLKIGDIAATDIDPSSRTRRVAVAFQEPYLLADTVNANVEYGIDLPPAVIRVATEVARVADVVATLPNGYETVLGERGVTLSGGQRQRLALARAVARKPGLLLLDDATSAIDPVVEEEILDRLRALDMTMIVVAQRRSTVALADRVAFIADGRVVAVGNHEDLMTVEPRYRSLLQAYELNEIVR